MSNRNIDKNSGAVFFKDSLQIKKANGKGEKETAYRKLHPSLDFFRGHKSKCRSRRV